MSKFLNTISKAKPIISVLLSKIMTGRKLRKRIKQLENPWIDINHDQPDLNCHVVFMNPDFKRPKTGYYSNLFFFEYDKPKKRYKANRWFYMVELPKE